ncbi:MAG: methylmalonyl-CoA decarboxylase [Elusimicrobia bacterium]|nr:methylmalonyl-CoA decarboxylase [Elusimicrobiota bacterium]
MGFITTETRGKVGFVTFDNPGKRNALCAKLLEELAASFERLRGQRVPVVILRTAPGAKVWSAGADIAEMEKQRHDPFGYDTPLEQALRAVETYPGPVLAMVRGGVWGKSCDLMLTCDLVVGDPSFTFAITPVKVGLPYNASGILHFINHLGLNRAKELFFTAEPIDARRALDYGILNHLVEPAELDDFTLRLAEGIAAHSPLSVNVIKEQFRILSGAHPISPDTFERIEELRRKVFESHDYTEGIRAFLEKRPPRFRGD